MAGNGAPRRLRELLERKRFFAAPGVYDGVSARVAEQVGFEALYMTGYGVSVSHLGQPDAGLATYTDMVGRVRQIAEITSAPLIADADTGFGGLVNVRQTIRGYERAGAAAVQIEDQEMPKRCGHTPGRRVIPTEEMVLKIKVAAETRENPDLVIIARTDARTEHGLDEALRRGEAYARAAADVLFIESPESEDELARVGAAFDVPVLANMVTGGSRTPVVPADRLAALGFSFAIYPALGIFAAAAGMRRAYDYLKRTGGAAGIDVPLLTSDEMHALAGFPEIWTFERDHGSTPAATAPSRAVEAV